MYIYYAISYVSASDIEILIIKLSRYNIFYSIERDTMYVGIYKL